MSIRVWRWVSLAVCMALVVVAFGVLPKHQQPASKKLGRFSEKEIIVRSAPIGQAITSGRSDLHYSATSGESRLRTGVKQRVWLVDATAPDGRHVLSMIWNADTGSLQSVGVKGKRTAEVARVTRPQAEWLAQQWVRSLGLAGNGKTWRLKKTPYRLGVAWLALWTSGDQRIMVNVDAVTGGLLAARAYSASAG